MADKVLPQDNCPTGIEPGLPAPGACAGCSTCVTEDAGSDGLAVLETSAPAGDERVFVGARPQPPAIGPDGMGYERDELPPAQPPSAEDLAAWLRCGGDGSCIAR